MAVGIYVTQYKWHSAWRTLSITTLWHYAEFCYGDCHILYIVMLKVIVPSVVMLSVLMVNVIMLSVEAPAAVDSF